MKTNARTKNRWSDGLTSILSGLLLMMGTATALAQTAHYNAGTGSGGNGDYSAYVGENAGKYSLSDAYYNSYLGTSAGEKTTNGGYNTIIGGNAGYKLTTGSRNVYLGLNTGMNNTTGSGNVLIGHEAGRYGVFSNKLYIDNSPTGTPLVYGDFSTDKVGINTTNFPSTIGGKDISTYSLFVKGGILTDEARIRTSWADYVFSTDYALPTLKELEEFIIANGHLPNVPSAKKVEEAGLEIGEITKIQQEKIEELTLYIIELNHKIDALRTALDGQMDNSPKTESHGTER